MYACYTLLNRIYLHIFLVYALVFHNFHLASFFVLTNFKPWSIVPGIQSIQPNNVWACSSSLSGEDPSWGLAQQPLPTSSYLNYLKSLKVTRNIHVLIILVHFEHVFFLLENDWNFQNSKWNIVDPAFSLLLQPWNTKPSTPKTMFELVLGPFSSEELIIKASPSTIANILSP